MRNPGAAPPASEAAVVAAARRGVAVALARAGRGGMPGFQGFTIAPREVIPLDQIADYYPRDSQRRRHRGSRRQSVDSADDVDAIAEG